MGLGGVVELGKDQIASGKSWSLYQNKADFSDKPLNFQEERFKNENLE